MPSPHADRLTRLRASLAHSQLDALLVTALPNVRYLTGFSGSNALVLVTADDALLLTDFRYAAQVKHEVAPEVQVIIEQMSLWTRLWKELKQLPRVQVIAFETAHVTHQDAAKFVVEGSEGAQWKWRPALNLVEVLRESKDDGELDHIRTAVEIAEHALARTLPQVRAGMTELAVAGILEYEMRVAGSERTAFETIVAAGARSALPHARASAQVIQTGDLLLFDFGATSGGYVSDITRTFIVGRAPDARQKEIHDIVREANGSASAAVRAGMRGRDADALARDYIERRGFGDAFGHSTGHGIGLEIHESPRLAKTAEAPLPPGSVVTIEPGIYLEGWGGVRIEDDVVLGTEGPVVLTSFERGLMQL
ncbi:MAG TPA: aminopeptidase P family protein [Gemmatimonadaceae bacterium]|nr:aminopeptidase P family protein [Gemmatimonadaceae bacterium]